jgi:dihydroneopterin aldolase
MSDLLTMNLERCRFFCNIGCTDEERVRKQEIFVTIEMKLDVFKSYQTDSLDDVIDYRNVHDVIRKTVEGKPYNLVETMVHDVLTALRASFPVKFVKVKLIKSRAMEKRDIGEVSVEVSHPTSF